MRTLTMHSRHFSLSFDTNRFASPYPAARLPSCRNTKWSSAPLLAVTRVTSSCPTKP